MNRAYYQNSIAKFAKEDLNSILGQLSFNHSNRSLEDLQKNAWVKQIKILKAQLKDYIGEIYFEFSIPRMGKRVDNIVIIDGCIFVVEFKVGDKRFENYAQEQVIDYSLDLKNFHEGSHTANLIPVLVATEANEIKNSVSEIKELLQVAKCNKTNLKATLQQFLTCNDIKVDVKLWEESIYKPTPTIVEAAQALYNGHNVKEISRSDAGAINLTKTANCLNRIIEKSKNSNKKTICFVTGVPGAGKTLAGLNIANERMRTDEDEHAVFLSGNGPLVDVLREALTRDIVKIKKEEGGSINKNEAKRETNTFIQNIHHFRDYYLKLQDQPTEKVVVFDEAQRAWTQKQLSSFMKRKKGIENFSMSEPEFLIDVMNRHTDWCTIVCLIGGGQEINTGEAGLEEWINAFKENYQDWEIHYSNIITNSKNYVKTKNQKGWLLENAYSEPALHLSVSVRSFRSEKLSEFIHEFLELNVSRARDLYRDIENDFPILMTRDLELAKDWLRKMARGTERTGLLISSGAKRLRSIGIDAENGLRSNSGSDAISNWFLNSKNDVRSSYYLEIPATQFVIQGLELDWTCVSWGADLRIRDRNWTFNNFTGKSWKLIRSQEKQEFLLNTYRVLLTRARQGMIIFIPNGSDNDHTRPCEFYDETWNYLKMVGINELITT